MNANNSKFISAEQAREGAVTALKVQLQPQLQFELQSAKQLYKAKNTQWYAALQEARDREEALLDHSGHARDAVDEVLLRGLEASYGDTLPHGLVSSSFLNESARSCQSLKLDGPEDRRLDLRQMVDRAGSHLLGAQKRSALPGFLWWVVLCGTSIASASALGYALSQGIISTMLFAIITASVSAGAVLSMAVLYVNNSNERRRLIVRTSNRLRSGWALLRQNAIEVAAHSQASAAMLNLAAQANQYSANNDLKRAQVEAKSRRNAEFDDAPLEAIRELPVYDGHLREGGRHRVSILKGRQVINVVRSWMRVDPEASLQGFAAYLSRHPSELRHWLEADAQRGFGILKDWLLDGNKAALQERTIWDTYQLDPTAAYGRLKELVEKDAKCATKTRRSPRRVQAFVISASEELLGEMAKQFEAVVTVGADKDEVRILVLGERQFTGPELLAGCVYSRLGLQAGDFWEFLPSPVVEQMVRDSHVIERAMLGKGYSEGPPTLDAAEDASPEPMEEALGKSQDGPPPYWSLLGLRDRP